MQVIWIWRQVESNPNLAVARAFPDLNCLVMYESIFSWQADLQPDRGKLTNTNLQNLLVFSSLRCGWSALRLTLMWSSYHLVGVNLKLNILYLVKVNEVRDSRDCSAPSFPARLHHFLRTLSSLGTSRGQGEQVIVLLDVIPNGLLDCLTLVERLLINHSCKIVQDHC